MHGCGCCAAARPGRATAHNTARTIEVVTRRLMRGSPLGATIPTLGLRAERSAARPRQAKRHAWRPAARVGTVADPAAGIPPTHPDRRSTQMAKPASQRTQRTTRDQDARLRQLTILDTLRG